MGRDGFSRRQVLGTAAGAVAVSIAGCTGDADDDDDDDLQELRESDWEGVDEIRLDGFTNGWVGVAPSVIEGVRNPTLLLFEGEEYEITWENQDGLRHNIEIRDEDNQVVDGYRTSLMGNRGDTQTLDFEATASMHQYLCEPHPRSMTGYIRTVSQ